MRPSASSRANPPTGGLESRVIRSRRPGMAVAISDERGLFWPKQEPPVRPHILSHRRPLSTRTCVRTGDPRQDRHFQDLASYECRLRLDSGVLGSWCPGSESRIRERCLTGHSLPERRKSAPHSLPYAVWFLLMAAGRGLRCPLRPLAADRNAPRERHTRRHQRSARRWSRLRDQVAPRRKTRPCRQSRFPRGTPAAARSDER